MRIATLGARFNRWAGGRPGVVALALWGVALLVRGVCWWHLPASGSVGLLMDEAHYHAEAWNLVEGIPRRADSYFMTPLYPFFLSLVFRIAGDSSRAVFAVQMLLGSSIVPVGFLIARRIMAPLAAVFVGLALATSGPLVHAEAQFLVEWLVAVAVTLAAMLALQSRTSTWRALLCGVCIGTATLARGSNLLLAVPLLLWLAWLDRCTGRLWLQRRRLPRWLLFGLGVAGALSPLLIHNAIHAKQPFLLTANAGMNFYIGNGPEATGLFQLPAGLDVEQDPMALRFVQRETSRPVTASEASDFWMQQTLAWIRAHPVHFIGLLARKVFLFWNQFSFPQLEQPALRQQIGAHVPVWWTHAVFPLALAALCTIAATALRRRGRSAADHDAELLAWLALAYGGSIAAFFITDRYRTGILPLLVVLAGWMLHRVTRVVAERRWVPAAALAFLVFLLFVATSPIDASTPLGAWIPKRSRIDVARLQVDAHVHDAVRHAAAGDLPRAIEAYQTALQLDPRNPDVRTGFARVLSQAKQDDRARDQLERVVAEHPDFARGWFNLGNVYRRLGQPEKAVAAYRKAIDLEPRREAAWNNLGEAYRAMGDTARAAEAYERAIAIVPLYEQALNNLAALRGATGDAARAEAGFRAAIAANPRYVPAWVNLAVTLTNSGRLQEAREAWRRVVLLDPDNAAARDNLARVEQALAR